MANSIKEANAKIIKLLADSGEEGLHIDDILYLLGFDSKKELQHRLHDLKNRQEIKEVTGGRWKKCPTAAMNGNSEAIPETFITPSLTEKEALPEIHLPGHAKFSSYKNSLQEYCQKKHFPVPNYKAIRESNGLIGTVAFALNTVRAEKIAGSVKEADCRAAYEALAKLGYLKDIPFEFTTNQLKRKDAGEDYASSVAKQFRSGQEDAISFKSQLNEFAQKKQLPFPTYETLTVNGGFFSTVTFNGNQFKSMATSKKRRDSEQNAAQVALHALVGTPLPRLEEQPMLISEPDAIAMVTASAQPVPLKNRLQEYCQRLGKTLPLYETKLNEFDKTYQCTVTVQGVQYTGTAMNGKKNAETAAAEGALRALELMA